MSEGSAGHAGLMDAVYRQQRHIYDLTRKFFLLGRDHLIGELSPPPGSAVLEVACGTGRNLIAVARRYPDCTLYGLDISQEMLRTAQASVKRAGLQDRIKLAQADACDFDPQALFGRADFERVFLSYSLSMIPDWQGALDQAARVTAPGGQMHVVDFGGQSRLPRWFARLLRHWLGLFHVSPRDQLQGELQQQGERSGMQVAFARLLRDYAQYGRLSRPT